MEELKALLKVKSIMTLTVMAVFVYGTLTKQLSSELVSSVISAVITYYFTKKENGR
ncbi:hypothetical protein [Longibaculum muris]|uniref:hypothetical protein n=1 Tax=Longibaculum muris TaxID=1796628 RepID=UPI002059AC78|nr:hypothetical protein [Longibaculum muris]DAZ60261.1 MAG TPA: hypothetical protein [Caudoviricetes sp.]